VWVEIDAYMRSFPICKCFLPGRQKKLIDGGYARFGVPKNLEKKVFAEPVS
jgi:hypothetical protein